jgi:hypothetical protein
MSPVRTAETRKQGARSTGHQPRATRASAFRVRPFLVGSGLVGLLGATAYAVASVSAWLVPVYLLLVVVILTAPRGQRASSRQKSPSPHPSRLRGEGDRLLLRHALFPWRRRPASSSPHRGDGARRADEGDLPPSTTGQPGHHPDEGSDPAGPSAEAESARLRLDPAATAPAKPRRTRARTRKAAKPAAEPAADSNSVTWIRVGPGKYVRSDAVDQGQPPAEAARVEGGGSSVEGEDPTGPNPPPITHHPPPSATASEVVPDPGPAAEEYGIAPSAFGPTPSEPLPAECREPVVVAPVEAIAIELEPQPEPGPASDPAADAEPVANAPGFAVAASGDRPQRLPRRSQAFTFLVPRGFAERSSAGETRVMPSRYGPRRPVRPRAEVRGRYAADPRRAGAARRASDRTEHVRRDRRARSPPLQ